MPKLGTTMVASALLAACACADRPEPEPVENPIERRVAPVRSQAAAVERQIRARALEVERATEQEP
ncbi:hypothetical protein BH20GEM2_BH20GEM2_14680 [soil metagenome]